MRVPPRSKAQWGFGSGISLLLGFAPDGWRLEQAGLDGRDHRIVTGSNIRVPGSTVLVAVELSSFFEGSISERRPAICAPVPGHRAPPVPWLRLRLGKGSASTALEGAQSSTKRAPPARRRSTHERPGGGRLADGFGAGHPTPADMRPVAFKLRGGHDPPVGAIVAGIPADALGDALRLEDHAAGLGLRLGPGVDVQDARVARPAVGMGGWDDHAAPSLSGGSWRASVIPRRPAMIASAAC